jgi:hypothetical protein
VSDAQHLDDGEVVVYRSGLTHCSVCCPSSMPVNKVVASVNLLNPTGIDSLPWKIAKEDFASGETNPTHCERSVGRVHRLTVC